MIITCKMISFCIEKHSEKSQTDRNWMAFFGYMGHFVDKNGHRRIDFRLPNKTPLKGILQHLIAQFWNQINHEHTY